MARTRTRRLRGAGGLIAVVTTVVLSAAALPAHAVPEGTILGAGRPGAVDGSYLVTLKEAPDPGASAPGTPASAAAGRRLAEAYGARISHVYGTVLHGFAVEADARQARRLAADPSVASVVQDTRVTVDTPVAAEARSTDNTTGTAARTPASWGLDRIDQPSRPLDDSYSWPKSAGARVTVYVIDTGVRITHKDFGGRARHGWDFVGGDGTAADGNGHGTHVAATVAGTSFGVAKKAKVVSVRVLDDTGTGTIARVIAGIDWVTRNARKPAVANLSLGGGYNAQLDAAVRASIRSGVTYTVAAGNEGRPAALQSPADVREAVTVGAVDRTDTRPAFSNHGSALDLFAPGVSITSASHRGDTARATFSGTSTAAPHAAGAAALYLADHPKATPAQVSRALVAGAANGKVSGRGNGSPNKILQVPPF
ncbi:S8 family peptidase [Streptomyces sp. Amel2xC10]|uniref:S8 family peptidase n=1 Tax=Streptomyces sp. Amel2xC10 TaxID=1305826 RepID=UPI000A084A7B|nr:S8 family peptidase [Streptomyces sp. Amel2xC10]SMF80001.1 Serine protease, subtilisin family [Streptomyces sp. Amel2xC10]